MRPRNLQLGPAANMRRKIILLADVVFSFALVVWCQVGRWVEVYGFSVYYSPRSDSWLPRPPSAVEYFRSFTCEGTALFATVFLMTSLVLHFVGTRATRAAARSVHMAFYGDTGKLIVKYFAFLFTLLIAPYFYLHVWGVQISREGRIAAGFAFELATFAIIIVVADAVIAARLHARHGTSA